MSKELQELSTSTAPMVIDVSNPITMYMDGGIFDQLQRVANLLAASELIPKHLQRKPADCFLVLQQALRWKMDPFAVCSGTFVVGGKLGYEGKLVAAAVNTSGRLENSLNYDFSGEGDQRTCRIFGTIRNEDEPREVTIVKQHVKTSNTKWDEIPDQMLAYRGAREWARRHLPEVILGVDEPEETGMINVTPKPRPKSKKKDPEPPKEEVVDQETGEVTDGKSEPEKTAETESTGSKKADKGSQASEPKKAEKEAEPSPEKEAEPKGNQDDPGSEQSDDPKPGKAALEPIAFVGGERTVKDFKADLYDALEACESEEALDSLLTVNEASLGKYKEVFSTAHKTFMAAVAEKREELTS